MKRVFFILTALLCFQLNAGPAARDQRDASGGDFSGPVSAHAHAQKENFPIELMALGPPLIADPRNPDWEGAAEWSFLESQLEDAVKAGIDTISVDVWWGLVQHTEGSAPESFDWRYYDKLFDMILFKTVKIDGVEKRVPRGLKIAPILSAHRYGGNVNDHGMSIPLPPWLVQKMMDGGWGYRSEVGNWNTEAISPWGVKHALPHFKNYWSAFVNRFGKYAPHFSKIVVGVGPAGEMVYPAYHAHDRAKPPVGKVSEAEFPGRGVLQHTSPLAVADFQEWLSTTRYSSIQTLNAAWSKNDAPVNYKSFGEIEVLKNSDEVDAFFAKFEQYSTMGQDFFDWYHESLLKKQGYALASEADSVIHAENSPLKGVRTALKVGGVHWQFHDRIPLLTAGLTSSRGAYRNGNPATSSWQPKAWAIDQGAGLLRVFRDVLMPLRAKSDWVGIFTCAEMENCHSHCLDTNGGSFGQCSTCHHAPRHIPTAQARSGARLLVEATIGLSKRAGIPIYFENALEGSVRNDQALGLIEHHLRSNPHALGVSLLRLGTTVQSHEARNFLGRLRGLSDRRIPDPPNCSDEILMLGTAEANQRQLN